MNQPQNKIDNLVMDEQQFARLLASYGGEAKRWPPEYRASAHQFLSHSVKSRHLQQTALALDTMLDTVQVSPPSPKLRQRILAVARRTANTTPDIWQRFQQWIIGTTPSEYFWRPAVTLLLPMLLGIIVGFYSTQVIYVDTKQSNIYAAELDTEITLFDLTNDDFAE